MMCIRKHVLRTPVYTQLIWADQSVRAVLFYLICNTIFFLSADWMQRLLRARAVMNLKLSHSIQAPRAPPVMQHTVRWNRLSTLSKLAPKRDSQSQWVALLLFLCTPQALFYFYCPVRASSADSSLGRFVVWTTAAKTKRLHPELRSLDG